MCQRIAARLACVVFVFSAALARAEEQPMLPPGPAPQYSAPPSSGPAPLPYLPTPAAVAPQHYGQPVPAPQFYLPVVGPFAPSAATSGCPGSFTIVANDHNTILLDTRDGTTWQLVNSSDGKKWGELKRDQIRREGRGPRARGVATPAPAGEASQHPDPFGDASPTADPFGVDEPEDQRRLQRQRAELRERAAIQEEGVRRLLQRMSELEQQARQRASEAKEAKEKAGKSLELIEALKNRNNELNDEIAELKEKLSEAEARPRVSSEPVEVKPAPLSE